MIDYDDSEVIWWMHEIEYIVRVMQSSWEEITPESVAREIHELYELYELRDRITSDDLLEMCDHYLQRYSDPFDGLGDVPFDLKILTESGKKALLTAVIAKSKLLKSHATRLDESIKARFGDNMENLTEEAQ